MKEFLLKFTETLTGNKAKLAALVICLVAAYFLTACQITGSNEYCYEGEVDGHTVEICGDLDYENEFSESK